MEAAQGHCTTSFIQRAAKHLQSRRSDGDVSGAVQQAIFDMVQSASRAQSIKGVFTAGLGRSLIYGWDKFRKRLGWR